MGATLLSTVGRKEENNEQEKWSEDKSKELRCVFVGGRGVGVQKMVYFCRRLPLCSLF